VGDIKKTKIERLEGDMGEYKIVKRDNGSAVTIYDCKSEEIVATVAAAEYMAWRSLQYAFSAFGEVRQDGIAA
jgi:hypothetical protein